MNKITICCTFVILTLLGCNFFKKNEMAILYPRHTKVIDFLKKSDYIKLKLNNLGFKTNKLYFKVAKRNIKPSLLSLQTILYQDSLYKPEGENISDAITDSLKLIMNLTEVDFSIQEDKNLIHLSDKFYVNWVVFFTDIRLNYIYCEVLYNGGSNLDYNNNFLNYFGTALTFLFIFDNNDNLIKVLTGAINYN